MDYFSYDLEMPRTLKMHCPEFEEELLLTKKNIYIYMYNVIYIYVLNIVIFFFPIQEMDKN